MAEIHLPSRGRLTQEVGLRAINASIRYSIASVGSDPLARCCCADTDTRQPAMGVIIPTHTRWRCSGTTHSTQYTCFCFQSNPLYVWLNYSGAGIKTEVPKSRSTSRDKCLRAGGRSVGASVVEELTPYLPYSQVGLDPSSV